MNGIQMDQWTVEEFISLLQNDQAIDVLQDVGILLAVKGEKTAGNIMEYLSDLVGGFSNWIEVFDVRFEVS